MFPYPSGKLHIGHVRNYTIGDVISRSNKMLGKKCISANGLGCSRITRENAAIKNNVHPEEWTKKNIEHMRSASKHIGILYDWQNELSTADPEYFRWEQWFFIKLLKKVLFTGNYQRLIGILLIKQFLQMEQVIDGRGWRSGAKVERKEIPQWFLKITEYADVLLSDLNKLSDWPESVKLMQKNWIGKSKGLNINFQS